MTQRVGALDVIGDARRRVAQHKAGDTVAMRRGQQQTYDPARGFADPVHLRQGQAVQHRQDLRLDRLGSVAIPVRRLIREAATEEVWTVDPVGSGDRRHPPVPERRIPGKPVHH